jgi:multidrug resistance protein
MFSIDGSIVAVALPTMMTDLNTTLPLIAWTLAGYTLAQVALQPAIAKFSDNFGRNRVFLACIFIFTLSSLLCALAPNVWVLIACRVLQAIGGSGLMPSATGIVVGTYPAHQRERLIGLFTSIIPMGAIIGPNLGGLILTQFSWRGIFFINLPIGLAIMFLLRRRFFIDNVLYGMGIFSVMSFVPYFAETRFGMSPAETGLLLTPRSVMMIAMSTVASVWLLKYGYRWPMVVGTSIVTCGLLLIGLASDGLRLGPIGLTPFWVILLAMTLSGGGMGTSAPAANNAGIALMPRQAAAIAGLRAMIRSLGGVLGQGIIVVIMEFAPERTLGLRYAFVGFGLLLLLSLPIVLTIPDAARERRRKRAEEDLAAGPSAVLEPLTPGRR